MAYVIDGNNVMGQTPGWHRDKDHAREQLLKQVADFAGSKKARVTVVFDGAPDNKYPDGSAYHGVKILYAHRGSDADARIEQVVESSSDPRGLTVVTSDRRLGLSCKSRGAKIVRSGDFRRIMKTFAEDKPSSASEKAVTDSGALDSWMRYFGVTPDDDR
ncbi:MAG TPA: NYN domain-containing protein [Blastocatellia bacterium]|nr:NYN domain-containing protein [Blastocatellia bacterium]